MWRNAVRAVKDNSEVRGVVSVKQTVRTFRAREPRYVKYNAEDVFEYAANFRKHVLPLKDSKYYTDPLYVSVKPLRDLDEQYVSLEKNE